MTYLRLLMLLLLAFVIAACGGEDATSEPADPTSETITGDPPAESVDEDESETPFDPASVTLPDVPADLDGIIVDFAGIEGGFDLEDVPFALLSVQCFGPAIGLVVTDDTTNEPPEAQLTINISTETTTGTYEVIQGSPAEDMVSIAGNIREENAAESVQFTRLQSGVIRIDNLPSAEGDTYTGTFQFTTRPSSTMVTSGEAGTDRDQELQVTGVFNIEATADQICTEE